MTQRAAFKKADVDRACKGVVAAGLPVARVEFNDNGFAVIVGEPEARPRRGRPTLADELYGPQA